MFRPEPSQHKAQAEPFLRRGGSKYCVIGQKFVGAFVYAEKCSDIHLYNSSQDTPRRLNGQKLDGDRADMAYGGVCLLKSVALPSYRFVDKQRMRGRSGDAGRKNPCGNILQ